MALYPIAGISRRNFGSSVVDIEYNEQNLRVLTVQVNGNVQTPVTVLALENGTAIRRLDLNPGQGGSVNMPNAANERWNLIADGDGFRTEDDELGRVLRVVSG